MPISQTCSTSDVLSALRAHQEAIGQIVLTARPQVKQLSTIAKEMDEQVLTPMEDTLDQIFSQINLTVKDLVKISGIQTGATRKEIETSLAKNGLSVVNGRVLVTKKGDLDLTQVRELHRLVGSWAGVQRLVPEVFPCINSDDPFAGTGLSTRFLLIITREVTEITPGAGCKADVATTREEVLGLDVPVAEVLLKHPELTRADLIMYVFWLGKPTATPQLKARALAYGMTENEYFDAVLRKSAPGYKVKVIDQPYQQLCVFSSTFGSDSDEILSRGFGTNSNSASRPAKIKLNPTSQDVLDEIRGSGVLTQRPGRTNAQGIPDYGSSPMQALSVIDFEKTLNAQQATPCLDATLDLSEIGEGLANGMNAVSQALNSLINEIVTGFMGILNKLTSMFSIIDGFLLKLLNCLFPPGLGFGGFDLTDGPLGKLLDLLNGGLDMFRNFFDLLGKLLNILAPLACIKATLADLGKSFTSKIPGLACILSLFSFDLCFQIGVDIGQMEADLAFQLLSAALSNLRLMLQTLLNFALNFPSDFQTSMCLPVETALLMVKLGLRSALANAGIPL